MQLNSLIDHTLLKPEATSEQIKALCQEAKKHQFKTVCIEKKWLSLAQSELKGSEVLPITVIAFPSGEGTYEAKAKEAKEAVSLGAKEVDMVLNRAYFKDRNYELLLKEMSAVLKSCGSVPVKVILETSELSDQEKIAACVIAKLAGCSFVKTSTGFSKGGATVSDIKLMRSVVGPEMGVKASGGIRTTQDALMMIAAGATRLGTSASVAIVTGDSSSSTKGY